MLVESLLTNDIPVDMVARVDDVPEGRGESEEDFSLPLIETSFSHVEAEEGDLEALHVSIELFPTVGLASFMRVRHVEMGELRLVRLLRLLRLGGNVEVGQECGNLGEVGW